MPSSEVNIEGWLNLASQALCEAGQCAEKDSPKLDAQLLLAHSLKQSRTYLYTYPEKAIPKAALENANALLEERKQGKPIAYLLGEAEFWGLTLKVSEHTLIPRGDTETLVEWALQLNLPKNAKVLDLGCGTGAIALALACEKPHWQITGVDFLNKAVELAQQNQRRHKLYNAQFKQSSWYENISDKYDLIISNPPYIEPNDAHLGQGDVRFEPTTALVADEQGLADIKHIIQNAPKHLNPNGWLMLEHGYNQSEAVANLFKQFGAFDDAQHRQDLAGHTRATGAKSAF